MVSAMGGVRRLGGLVGGLALAMVVAACGAAGTGNGSANGLAAAAPGSTSGPAGSGKLAVVAGENFWGDIAAQIGGDEVAVTSIISDPNADPHEYETSVNNAAAIAKASLVIVNGLGYDDFMARLLGASPKATREVLTIAKVVGVTGRNPNPHIWYDPSYVAIAARTIEARLAREQPADTALFAANLKSFLAGEQRVVRTIDTIKAKYQGTAIAYTERVPGYLVQAAGLHLGTPASFSQSIEDGNDPSPIDNAEFEQALRKHQVQVLLYNAQVTDAQTSHLKNLARSSHVPVVGVTETLPRGERFQTWQQDQAEALLAALGG
jgi:zinc/manganese transport system substrate-binding protein